MNNCFVKAKNPDSDKSRDYCEYDLDPCCSYPLFSAVNYVRVYAGKISLGVIKEASHNMIYTQKGKFFRIPEGSSFVIFEDFAIFNDNYYYGEPTWS